MVTASPPIIVDQYAPLAHKEIIGVYGDASQASTYTPSWVRPADRRRLAAYLVRAAYLGNVARLLLPSAEDADTYREYGDAATLVRRLVASVLGEGWALTVDGADDDLLAGPTLPEQPEDPGTDDAIAQRIYAGRLAAWERDAVAVIDEWEAALEAQPRARELQAALREWADRVHLAAHLHEAETDAVGLADAVIVLWPQSGDWPAVSVFEPDSYFPVLDDDARGEFPTEVHAVWEYVDTIDGKARTLIRRMTWRLVPVGADRVVDGEVGPEWVDGGPALTDDETMTDGAITRVMPWHGEGDAPTDVTCLFSDGVWDKARVEKGDPDALDFGEAMWWNTPTTDLRCDFIPVIHVPNTPAGKTHFGTSAIDNVAQVLDDLAFSDVDVMSAASYLGDPTVVVSGASVPADSQVMPGRMIGVGANGRMDVLDLSAGLTTLMVHGDRLADRLWQSAGVPGEVVGRANAEAESGVHLALKLAPYAQLIATMRLPREPKYRLLCRFAVKLAMIAGAVEAGPIGEPRLVFGTALPGDRAGAVAVVTAALDAGAISTLTAVQLLIAAGFPIVDAGEEVARIHAEDGATAKDIADATGAESLAAEWLGVTLPEVAATPPTIELAP